MNSIGSLILGIVILTAIFAIGGLLIWLFLGRKKKGADKMVGTLEQNAILKGGAPTSTGMRNGLR